MFSLIALTAVSYADRDVAAEAPEPCNQTEVLYMLPVHGSVALPSSVRPFVQFGGCDGRARIQVVDADDAVLTDIETEAYYGVNLELPSLDLEPGDYTMQILGMSGELLERSEFSVGVDVIDEMPASPLFEVYAYSYDDYDSWVNVEVYLNDFSGDGIVSVQPEGGEPVLAPLRDGIVYFSHDGDYEDEICYSARTRGVSGTWSDPETVCVTPDILDDYDEFRCGTGVFPFGLGCSSLSGTPVGGGLLLSALAGLLLRRRSSSLEA